MTRYHWFPAFIGIGSNLDSPLQQVKAAVQLLKSMADCHFVTHSSFYRSSPLCGKNQPDYVNAVAAILTVKTPHDLLKQLNAIEHQQGRVRSEERWESRVLDLDLLSYGNQQIADDVLTVPHPGVAERDFVLIPWREIYPHYVIPGLGSVSMLASENSSGPRALEKID